MVEGGSCLNGQKRQIQGKWILELIVEDFGYTQSEWMLVPLPGRYLRGIYDDYNYKQSNTRIVVEQAFGRLKGIWRVLHCPIWNPDEKLVPKFIHVCCLLHNIMLEYNDIVDDDVPLVGHHDEGRRQQISRQVISSKAAEI
jgi:hypothetical protein